MNSLSSFSPTPAISRLAPATQGGKAAVRRVEQGLDNAEALIAELTGTEAPKEDPIVNLKRILASEINIAGQSPSDRALRDIAKRHDLKKPAPPNFIKPPKTPYVSVIERYGLQNIFS